MSCLRGRLGTSISHDCFLVKAANATLHQFAFSAECTIGMVWGLTSLKQYGNKVLTLMFE